jgi:hypothetical protein
MQRENQEKVYANRKMVDCPTPHEHDSCERPSYRTPQLVPIGKAVDLVKNNYTGQLRDGTGGWYVWGS